PHPPIEPLRNEMRNDQSAANLKALTAVTSPNLRPQEREKRFDQTFVLYALHVFPDHSTAPVVATTPYLTSVSAAGTLALRRKEC
ncbi:MAG: hypothetical protein ACRDJE_00190, partial [Dehalococcoidia bacterium]